jgi:hypothetical protein
MFLIAQINIGMACRGTDQGWRIIFSTQPDKSIQNYLIIKINYYIAKTARQFNPMKTLSFIFLLAIITGSCKKKPDPAPVNTTPACTNNGTMTVTLDGTSYTPGAFNNTLTPESYLGQNYRWMNIKTTVNGGILELGIENFDWQLPPLNGILSKTYENFGPNTSCKDFNGIGFCDGITGTYTKNNIIYSNTDQSLPGNITVSSCDTINKTITGTFSVKVVPPDKSDTLTFSGSFTNQCYNLK